MPIRAAIHAKLAGDSTLTSQLATYMGVPAIFSFGQIPEDAPLPRIVTIINLSDLPFDTKGDFGREIQRDVSCYTEATGDTTVIESISERVRFLLHQTTLTVAGFSHVLSEVINLIDADEEDIYGKVLTVRVLLQ